MLQPTLSLQWGHGISAVEMNLRMRCDGTPRFNGATAFLPWKFTKGSMRSGASMGPRHFCRGNDRMPSLSRMPCFNGATAFLPWKLEASRRYLKYSASMGPRHFCRGNPTISVVDHLATRVASMGPRHFCRGNGSYGYSCSSSCSGSQCERQCRCSIMDSCRTTYIASFLQTTDSNSDGYTLASASSTSTGIGPLASCSRRRQLHHL